MPTLAQRILKLEHELANLLEEKKREDAIAKLEEERRLRETDYSVYIQYQFTELLSLAINQFIMNCSEDSVELVFKRNEPWTIPDFKNYLNEMITKVEYRLNNEKYYEFAKYYKFRVYSIDEDDAYVDWNVRISWSCDIPNPFYDEHYRVLNGL
jgi:tRNA 2-selenouridine synthase SelU